MFHTSLKHLLSPPPGYGTIAPSTSAGQTVFIFYAIIGIPIALIFLAMIGKIIKAWVNRVLKPVERRFGAVVSRTVGSIAIFLTVVIFFLLIPAAIYDALEDWTYSQSVYYTVVTLTTVGFGDFVPAQATEGVTSAISGMYKLMSAVWLWIGLALVAALISEIQSTLESAAKWCRSNPCCGLRRLRNRFRSEKMELKEPVSPDPDAEAVVPSPKEEGTEELTPEEPFTGEEATEQLTSEDVAV